jgi:hypothetical protein
MILKSAIYRQSTDNLTAILIILPSCEQRIKNYENNGKPGLGVIERPISKDSKDG